MEQIEAAKLPVERKIVNVGLRANMPTLLRILALLVLVGGVVAIVVAFYFGSSRQFIMHSGPKQLSKEVTASVTGYERRESEGDKTKYYIKAERATTFSDNHVELEGVNMNFYDEKEPEKFDQITSNKAIYVPDANDTKLFDAYFNGNVVIQSKDGLEVKTQELSYNRASQKAESQEHVDFKRDNIVGKSTGAIVRMAEKQLELLKEVEINANEDPTLEVDKVSDAKLQSAKFVGDHAIVYQNDNKIEADQNVFINLVPNNKADKLRQPTDIKADKAVATFVDKQIRNIDLTGNVDIYAKPTDASPKYTKMRANHAVTTIDKELNTAELTENVYIETTQNAQGPTVINSQYAFYSKPEDKFDLKGGVEIVTQKEKQPTTTHSSEATYFQTQGKVFLNGNAEILQGNEIVKGDAINADLYPNKKVQNAFSRGNAYLKQVTPERTTEVTSNELNAVFSDAQQVQTAHAVGNGNVTIVPNNQQQYTKFSMSAPNAIDLTFRPTPTESVLSQMTTNGRTTIDLAAPAGKPNAANKKIVGDTVNTVMNSNGKDLVKAEVIGNAELYVNPLEATKDGYNTIVTAPRFDCDFYEAGNVAKTCVGSVKAKSVMKPMVPAETHGVRTLWGDRLVSNFDQNTGDVRQFDSFGNSKFTELDRTGIANQFTYVAGEEVVHLRGGEPTVWDTRARARATEIDWDTKNQKSFLRGKVSTTYYSQKQTNGAAPFSKTNSPVFVTSDQSQFDHARQIGIYTGNARAWQDNNYIRGNELVFYEKEQRMDAEGKVQSALYSATRKENGKLVNQPAYTASDKFKYTGENRLLHYEGNVDIRQGTDRTVAGLTDIYLDENNDIKQSISQNNVTVTQPNRTVRGNWVQYTAADGIAIIRGNPATVEDAEQGSTQGSQITVAMRENKMTNQGAVKGANGRTRTVYKVKEP